MRYTVKVKVLVFMNVTIIFYIYMAISRQPISSLLLLNQDETQETFQQHHFLSPQIQPVFLNQNSLF